AAVASLYAALLAAVPARHHEHLFPAASCSPKTEAPPLQALLDLPSRVASLLRPAAARRAKPVATNPPADSTPPDGPRVLNNCAKTAPKATPPDLALVPPDGGDQGGVAGEEGGGLMGGIRAGGPRGRRGLRRKKLDEATQAASVWRLHHKGTEARQRQLAKTLEELQLRAGTARVLSPVEQEVLAHRLCTEQGAISQQVAADLRRKYVPEQVSRTIGPRAVERCNQRLFYAWSKQVEEHKQQLFTQYVSAQLPATRTLTKAEQASSADRLSQYRKNSNGRHVNSGFVGPTETASLRVDRHDRFELNE
ncbi:hypothetical protein DIPPA_24224, partial [Diplonema papillatum]